MGTPDAVTRLFSIRSRPSLVAREECVSDGHSFECSPRPSRSFSLLPRDVLFFIVKGDADGFVVVRTATWTEVSPGEYITINPILTPK